MEIYDFLIYNFNPDPRKITFEVAYVPLVEYFIANNGPFQTVDEFVKILLAYGKGLLEPEKIIEALQVILKRKENENEPYSGTENRNDPSKGEG